MVISSLANRLWCECVLGTSIGFTIGVVDILAPPPRCMPGDDGWLLRVDFWVSLVGFGTFSVKHRAARAGRNPQTGQEIQIKAANVPSFKAGKALKDSVN